MFFSAWWAKKDIFYLKVDFKFCSCYSRVVFKLLRYYIVELNIIYDEKV